MHKKVSLNCGYCAIVQSPSVRELDWAELRRTAVQAALQVLDSRQDAEDAAQEAVARAWRSRTRCAAAESPQQWIARVARNEALRIGGRLSNRRRAEGALLGEVSEAAADDPPAAESEEALDEALRKLPIRDRELVTLRYVEDLQYSIIAERLGMPLGTVKVRLHRLHAALREATYA
jgi:RNA polymerase sigma-70 factor, ECF subfamily